MRKIENSSMVKYVVHPVSFIAEHKYVSTKHWQKEVEAVFVISGWLNVLVDEKKYHLNQGEMIFISSGVAHAFLEEGEGSVVEVIKFVQSNLCNQSFYKNNNEAIIQLYNQVFMVKKTAHIQGILTKIICSDYGEVEECFIAAKLLELSVYLLKHNEVIFNATNAKRIETTQYLDSIFYFIEANFHHKISLTMIAEHIGITETYCSKYIKKKTGITFIEYLTNVRVSKVEEYLIETDKCVTEIAYLTGFSSIQTFNRVFKKLIGKSPRTYRNEKYNKK